MKGIQKLLIITGTLFLVPIIGAIIYLIITNPVTMVGEDLKPQSDFAYFTTRDGIKLYSQEIKPELPPKGMVVFFQGINGGGYKGLLNDQLAVNGFSSNVIHQRGTGYSEGVKGDLKSFDIVEEDYQKFLNIVKKKNPGKPLFILGHSLGGDFCIWIASKRTDLAGAILINPATKYQMKKIPFGAKMKFMFDYMFRRSALTIDVSPPQKISNEQDKQAIAISAQDKLSLKKMSVRYAIAAQTLWNESAKNASTANSPLLVIYGDKDEVVDHSETEKVYAVWQHADKTKIIISGSGHGGNIFDKCMETIIQWTNRESQKTQSSDNS